jgi:hypothetical protein
VTVYAKFLRLKENKYLLTRSDKDFMDSLAEGLGGFGDDICDEDLADYLSPKQMINIRRIYDEVF